MAGDGHVLVVFRSRLRADVDMDGGYKPEADRMVELAFAMPGFVSFKQFTADDGERVSIIEFDSREHEEAWRDHPEHRQAQQRGRAEFYAEYRIQVADIRRDRQFSADS